MEVVEVLFCPILAVFNILLWRGVRAIQTENTCPNGAGHWVLFGGVKPIGVSTGAPSITVLTVAILMGSWQIISALATAARLAIAIWDHEKTLPQDIARGSQFHPVFWWLEKRRRKEHVPLDPGTRWVVCIGIRVLQLAIVTYGIITVERTAAVNGIESSENHWGFGQIAAMFNLLGPAGLACYRVLHWFVLLVGFTQ